MQQYFAFGYHQCRWGYQNWTVLQDVVDNFKKANIPLETIWTDIDYMNQYRDFENDQNTFSYTEGAEFLRRLHTNGQLYVPIVDSAIYSPSLENASDAYPPFDRGVNSSAFMLNADGSLYIGEVWPGYTVFPDWVGAVLNGTRAFTWWAEELLRWHTNVSFDGIWIDMSEVSSFCVGSCGNNNLTLNPVHPPFPLPGERAPASESSEPSASSATQSYLRTKPTPGVRSINYPPYVINNVQGDLAAHAASPNATHHGGMVEYDTHNLFGHQILNATYHGLLSISPSKRPFVIGRSTFPGSGKWAGHWGGDNASLWAYLVLSISQALSFSIFGIPVFGVDTCGFNGNTTMELCSRWMQLSAFFPFYRNHNSLSMEPQEPYVWSQVASASRTAMATRYSLLPYMYTLFAQAHSSGSTVMRALSWEFPNQPWLANADHQFMLVPAIMVTPCLEEGAATVDGVFPGIGDGMIWYDSYNHTAIGTSSQSYTSAPTALKAGQNVTLDAPLGHIPVFVRGGSVLVLQKPGMTTAASRQNSWEVLVALDKNGTGAGTLYLDDGESVAPDTDFWIQLSASKGSLTAHPLGAYVDSSSLETVTVMDVTTAPTRVFWNGHAIAHRHWTYTQSSQLLEIKGLNKNLTSQPAWTASWKLDWM